MEDKLLTADRFVDQKTGCSYRYVYSSTEYLRPHYHDYYEIFLMLEGSAIHLVNGTKEKISRGKLVLIRPFDHHDYCCDNGGSFSMLNITFTEETARELFDYLGKGFPSESLLSLPLPPGLSLTEVDMQRIAKRMDRIRAIAPKDHELRKTSLRILLFDVLTRHFSSFKPVADSMPQWLEELCETVKAEGNFAQGSAYFFSLTDKSREHVSRCMKKYTGMTVSEYINTLRLHYIANMLRDSNHSITQIIFDSGFNNISWASELFKKKYGMNLRDYRNMR